MWRTLIGMLATLVTLTGGVLAQQDRILQYDVFIQDRITDEQFEISYAFKGVEGDLVLFEMVATEDSSDLGSPEIVLFDQDDEVLADTFRHFGLRQARILMALPYTGAYEVMVTRNDGRAGDDVGDFRLRAIQPPVLVPGETISDAILNDRNQNYYLIQSDEPFSVYYEFANGDFDPTIEGFSVEEGELNTMASLRGRGLLFGSIGMDGSTAPLHAVTVGTSLYGSINPTERADYRLRLTMNE